MGRLNLDDGPRSETAKSPQQRQPPPRNPSPPKPAGARNNPVSQTAYSHSMFDDETEQDKAQKRVRERLLDHTVREANEFSHRMLLTCLM